jgi:hypothetical protein
VLVRGTTVLAGRRYAKRYHGTPEWQEFIGSLEPHELNLVMDPIRRSGWYDVEHYAGMLGKAAECLAPDAREEFLCDGGHFIVDDGVTTIYRAFYRIASPSFVLRSSALFWRLFFKGSKLKIRDSGKTFAHAQVVGASFCCMPLCISIRGGMMSALEHAGARDVKAVSHSCRSEGGSFCEYRFTWTR